MRKFSAFFFQKRIFKLFKLKKISLLGHLDSNEIFYDKNLGSFWMNSLFKFCCSKIQAHSFFRSHFHNLHLKERERKDKIRVSKFFQASMLFFLLWNIKIRILEKDYVFKNKNKRYSWIFNRVYKCFWFSQTFTIIFWKYIKRRVVHSWRIPNPLWAK